MVELMKLEGREGGSPNKPLLSPSGLRAYLGSPPPSPAPMNSRSFLIASLRKGHALQPALALLRDMRSRNCELDAISCNAARRRCPLCLNMWVRVFKSALVFQWVRVFLRGAFFVSLSKGNQQATPHVWTNLYICMVVTSPHGSAIGAGSSIPIGVILRPAPEVCRRPEPTPQHQDSEITKLGPA